MFKFSRFNIHDYLLLKSFDPEVVKQAGVNIEEIEEDLQKALKSIKGKPGYIQREITVKRNGKTFTRKQWVKAPEAKKNEGPKMVMDKTTARNKIRDLKKKYGKEGVLKLAKELGIKWNEHSHEGVNYMRAAMALRSYLERGGKINESILQKQPEKKPEVKKQPKRGTSFAQMSDEKLKNLVQKMRNFLQDHNDETTKRLLDMAEKEMKKRGIKEEEPKPEPKKEEKIEPKKEEKQEENRKPKWKDTELKYEDKKWKVEARWAYWPARPGDNLKVEIFNKERWKRESVITVHEDENFGHIHVSSDIPKSILNKAKKFIKQMLEEREKEEKENPSQIKLDLPEEKDKEMVTKYDWTKAKGRILWIYDPHNKARNGAWVIDGVVKKKNDGDYMLGLHKIGKDGKLLPGKASNLRDQHASGIEFTLERTRDGKNTYGAVFRLGPEYNAPPER